MSNRISPKKYIFPEGFLWGTATAAYQVEGNNTNSDWWEWERTKIPRSSLSSADQKYPLEESGIACDSYNRYEEDFDLCTKMNNNAVRISVEWARIEPSDGIFDQEQIEHYKKVIRSAKDKGLKVFVTLHHFTNPKWFSKLGGWESSKSPYYFSRYAKKCTEEFGKSIDAYITINEPQVYAMQGFLVGKWFPCKRSMWASLIVQRNFVKANNMAYDIIKSVDKDLKVGLVKHIAWYKNVGGVIDAPWVKLLNFINSDFFLWPIRKHLDFIGLNFYFTTYIKNFRTANLDDRNSDLNWWINAEGLEQVLLNLRKYKLPIYVTENGLADAKDRLRKDFMKDMLISCGKALEKEVDLKGYFHWSLIDNFEWAHGFWPRFGLVEIDRTNNLKRIPRPSSFYYGSICKDNYIEE
jgi:beta-glucosidase